MEISGIGVIQFVVFRATYTKHDDERYSHDAKELKEYIPDRRY
jgi:hypothetical protein